ncbi:MAG: DNA-binding response regulator [Bacteroidetes bacterium]|jgi:DNA-binding LytR/AlgR family response regulator|nr:MAG: DNA-binding response regulator [Bacteroidota bacterium]
MRKISCLIVDDDLMSQRTIGHLIERSQFLETAGTAADAESAMRLLAEGPADVIFLDIEMPGMNGIEFLRELKPGQQVVVVSSHRDYAFDAFDCNVTDYLLKPVTFARFMRAALRLKERLAPLVRASESTSQMPLFIKDKGQFVQVPPETILWVEALGDYVQVHTQQDKRYVVHSSLKNVIDRLPAGDFLRVHRSYIVRLDKINAFEDHTLAVGKKLIPIGKSYRKEIQSFLNPL